MNPEDLVNIKSNIKNNLIQDKQLWTKQEVVTFLKILNIHQYLKDSFQNLKITGEKLFTSKYGPSYIYKQFQSFINQSNYLPISKLLILLQWIINDIQDPWDYSYQQLESLQSPNQRLSVIGSQQDDSLYFSSQYRPKQKYVEFSQDIIQSLSKQFDKVTKLNIVDLTQNDLLSIFTNIKCTKYNRILQNYHPDGFALIYTLMDDHIVQNMKNYFPQRDLNLLQELSQLFVFFYSRQIFKKDQQNNIQYLPQLPCLNKQTTQESNSDYSPQRVNRQNTNKKQVQITTVQITRKESNQKNKQDEQQQKKLQDSQIDFNAIIQKKNEMSNNRKSIRQSQNGRNSDVRYSQLGVSEYAVSQRGSVYAQSVYADSVMMDSYVNSVIVDDQSNQNPNWPKSSIENTDPFKQLKEISPQLPFNLFILDPLKWIRVTQLHSPFAKQLQNSPTQASTNLNDNQTDSGKPQTLQQINQQKFSPTKKNNSPLNSKIFSLRGAKFGRQQNNEFCYPDQRSISGNHARIYFNGGSFFLQDLGSKTGTFIRIQNSMIIHDGAIIQLSYEVQILFKILKKEQTQAIVKISFIKPEDYQGFKVSVKSGFPIKIGRSDSSHIKIDQKRTKVSAKHACIKYQGKNFWFIDRQSSGGSWLRLSKKEVKSEGYKLSLGDIFRISSKKSFIIEQIKQIGEAQNQQKKQVKNE